MIAHFVFRKYGPKAECWQYQKIIQIFINGTFEQRVLHIFAFHDNGDGTIRKDNLFNFVYFSLT